jgi:hypothetical protein
LEALGLIRTELKCEELNRQDAKIAEEEEEKDREKDREEEDCNSQFLIFYSSLSSSSSAILASWRFNSSHFNSEGRRLPRGRRLSKMEASTEPEVRRNPP